MTLLKELFSILETHFNTTTDIIPVIKILREIEISDWQQYIPVSPPYDTHPDNNNTYNSNNIFINDKFKVCIITWSKNNVVDYHIENDCVFKILKGEMTEHIKSEYIQYTLKNIFITGYTGYMSSNNGVSSIHNKDETVSIHIHCF